MPHRRAGELIAATLAGAWRQSVSAAVPIEPQQLEAITADLRRCGSAGLAWRRIRRSSLQDTPAAALLRDDSRYQALRCATFEMRIAYLFRLFSHASIDALLLKGRAAAACYAHPALRPSGDVDVLVRPADLARARELLGCAQASQIDTDLHGALTDLPDRNFESLYGRSRVLEIEGQAVRVLGLEDHIAHVSLHFMRHHAWRPVWLCDVAAAVESSDPALDWNICGGDDPLRAKWIAAVLALARVLLGADLRALPQHLRGRSAPRSLVRYTLAQWRHADSNMPPAPLSTVLLGGPSALRAVSRRWPEPIEAAMHFGRSPDGFHLPYQLALMAKRAARYCRSAVHAVDP